MALALAMAIAVAVAASKGCGGDDAVFRHHHPSHRFCPCAGHSRGNAGATSCGRIRCDHGRVLLTEHSARTRTRPIRREQNCHATPRDQGPRARQNQKKRLLGGPPRIVAAGVTPRKPSPPPETGMVANDTPSGEVEFGASLTLRNPAMVPPLAALSAVWQRRRVGNWICVSVR